MKCVPRLFKQVARSRWESSRKNLGRQINTLHRKRFHCEQKLRGLTLRIVIVFYTAFIDIDNWEQILVHNIDKIAKFFDIFLPSGIPRPFPVQKKNLNQVSL